MKSLFVIALLCASLSSFSQIQGTLVKGCGYAFQTFAITAGVAAAQTVIATSQDHPIIVNPQVTQQSDGSWCFSFFAYTLPEPIPLEGLTTPAQVEDVAKVIKSQDCNVKPVGNDLLIE